MQKLALAIKIGGETKVLQRTPHLVILDKNYYMTGIIILKLNYYYLRFLRHFAITCSLDGNLVIYTKEEWHQR